MRSYGEPAEAGLGTFEDQELEQLPVVMNRDTPFLVVVADVERVRSAPPTASHHARHGREHRARRPSAANRAAQGASTQRRSTLPRGMAFLTLLILARSALPQPLETVPRVISLRVALAAFLAMRRAPCE